MKRSARLFAVIFSVFALFCSSSCKKAYSSVDLYYFNTYVSVRTDGTLSDKTLKELEDCFSSLEKEFSADGESSLTAKFNRLKSGESLTVDDSAAEVLALTEKAYSFTGGKFDPTVFPLVKLWGFYPDYPVSDFSLPSTEEIDEILSSGAIGFSNVRFDSESKTLSKSNDAAEMDFGGILKGYALDKGAEILKNAGHEKGYLSIGSSSIYILSSDSLGIKHPRAAADIPLILSVNLKGEKNLAVSTSGDYEKTYTVNGKNYSHIISPKTGYPADTGVVSATVIGENGGMLDAISTALCLCSRSDENDELMTLVNDVMKEYPETKIFVIYHGEEKSVITNQKQGEDFSLLDDEYSVVNVL